jgi:CubicO group peptidase (beta-lactamase class C family)
MEVTMTARSRTVLYSMLVFGSLILVSYGFIATTQEASDRAAEINRLFSRFDGAMPGAAVAVVRNGEIVFSRGYGLANLEYGIPITNETVFHVASVSKQFTAFAVALLADEGLLSLDDDVRTYMPEFPDFGETVTLRHLIHHTSGLRDQWELLAMAGWRMDDVITTEHILKMLSYQRELNFSPGEEYLYSNMGYTVLAEVIERVTGQTFADWMRSTVFEPLGMERTHFHHDHRHIVPGRAYSYQPGDGDGDGYIKSVLNYANVGATSLFTTVDDLARWLINFETKVVGNDRILNTMQRRGLLNSGRQISYAFALSVNEYRGALVIGHGGADAGYRSFAARFPEHDIGIVVLSNLGTVSPEALAYRIADLYLGDELHPMGEISAPAERNRASIDPSVLERYVGRYKMQPGLVLSMTRRDDRLFMHALGQDRVELIPMDEVTFYRDDLDMEIAFETSGDGNVYHLTVKQGGISVPAIRIDGRRPTADPLQTYEGEYYSDELGTFYTITVRDDALIAMHRRHNDIELVRIVGDRFMGDQWWFRSVEFQRDAGSTIEGFRLSGGRVRNIWFEKR